MADNNQILLIGALAVGGFLLTQTDILSGGGRQAQRRQRQASLARSGGGAGTTRAPASAAAGTGSPASATSGASLSSLQSVFNDELPDDPQFTGRGVTNEALAAAIESPATNAPRAEIGTDFDTELGISPQAKDAIENTGSIVGRFGSEGDQSAFTKQQRIATAIDIAQSAARGASSRERRQKWQAFARDLKGRLEG